MIAFYRRVYDDTVIILLFLLFQGESYPLNFSNTTSLGNKAQLSHLTYISNCRKHLLSSSLPTCLNDMGLL